MNTGGSGTLSGKNPNPIAGGKAQPAVGRRGGMTVAEKTKMKEI